LVEIDALGERLERGEGGCIRARDVETGAHLELPDPDAGRREALERRRGLFPLDRHVAGVEADGQVATQALLARAAPEAGQRGEPCRGARREEMTREEGDRVVDRLELAAGLGLEREDDPLPRL